jgi:hypothetical protein
MILGRCDEHGI